MECLESELTAGRGARRSALRPRRGGAVPPNTSIKLIRRPLRRPLQPGALSLGYVIGEPESEGETAGWGRLRSFLSWSDVMDEL